MVDIEPHQDIKFTIKLTTSAYHLTLILILSKFSQYNIITVQCMNYKIMYESLNNTSITLQPSFNYRTVKITNCLQI